LSIHTRKAVTTFLASILIGLTFCVSQTLALTEEDFQFFGRRYGVSPYLLRAISIVESREGRLTGSYLVQDVGNAIQLKYLQKIAESTGRSMAEFKGSHAGAMGYMQIIPSTFFYYGQDGNGDGMKDPLNDYDSLATAAYFLARRIAKQDELYQAIQDYNPSTNYCQKVLRIYVKLEMETRFAGLIKYFQPVSP
jgi:membrane-bound lytic murein transglycosylase B